MAVRVKDAFTAFGEVQSCNIIKDKFTGGAGGRGGFRSGGGGRRY